MSMAFARLLEKVAEDLGIGNINHPLVKEEAQRRIDSYNEQAFEAEKEQHAVGAFKECSSCGQDPDPTNAECSACYTREALGKKGL